MGVTFACIGVVSTAHADKLTLYFQNDSVNGFQLSDAYETHNMGIRYEKDTRFVELDFGLVTPDMWEYRNRYRVANRSFGEIITLRAGQKLSKNTNQDEYYFKVRASGQFGLDVMQDFAHKILSLQPVNEINDLVRMPDKIWFGTGLKSSYDTELGPIGDATVSYDVYLGSDTTSLQVDVKKSFSQEYFDINYTTGIRAVLFDDIVSAGPISATERSLIPFAEFQVNFRKLGHEFYVSEHISLPTIATDDRVFAVLSAGVTFDF